jgi:hypothetical protein
VAANAHAYTLYALTHANVLLQVFRNSVSSRKKVTFTLPTGARLLPKPVDLTSDRIVGLGILRLIEFDDDEDDGAGGKRRGWCVGRVVRAVDGAHPGRIRVCWCDEETAFLELKPRKKLYLRANASRSRAPLYTWALFTMKPEALDDV